MGFLHHIPLHWLVVLASIRAAEPGGTLTAFHLKVTPSGHRRSPPSNARNGCGACLGVSRGTLRTGFLHHIPLHWLVVLASIRAAELGGTLTAFHLKVTPSGHRRSPSSNARNGCGACLGVSRGTLRTGFLHHIPLHWLVVLASIRAAEPGGTLTAFHLKVTPSGHHRSPPSNARRGCGACWVVSRGTLRMGFLHHIPLHWLEVLASIRAAEPGGTLTAFHLKVTPSGHHRSPPSNARRGCGACWVVSRGTLRMGFLHHIPLHWLEVLASIRAAEPGGTLTALHLKVTPSGHRRSPPSNSRRAAVLVW
ncbi:Uncharacterised protein [Pandoraea pulmonicola]|uniref:Uncharacterized protein n=1 Tax=Pandoraea pulmonicola TaxID=93221 RepID=A0AAJ4ZCV7_PANPU|nr:Uncharacterised protein [Pandoraea pulmonicola]